MLLYEGEWKKVTMIYIIHLITILSFFGYSDCYEEGNLDDKKALLILCFFMGDVAFTWALKQPIGTLSTFEMEFISTILYVYHMVWVEIYFNNIICISYGLTQKFVEDT